MPCLSWRRRKITDGKESDTQVHLLKTSSQRFRSSGKVKLYSVSAMAYVCLRNACHAMWDIARVVGSRHNGACSRWGGRTSLAWILLLRICRSWEYAKSYSTWLLCQHGASWCASASSFIVASTVLSLGRECMWMCLPFKCLSLCGTRCAPFGRKLQLSASGRNNWLLRPSVSFPCIWTGCLHRHLLYVGAVFSVAAVFCRIVV